ncbi:MAG: hypothetical protein ABR598_05635 [Candidatus Dormibacteria bacterium]
MLAIPLITLQAVVEVAIGGFLALFITDLTRLVTRGFLASTGGVLLLIGVLGVAGEFAIPDPTHFTEHALNRGWLTPSLRLTAAFMVLFLVYLVTVYLRPPILHVVVGFLASAVGLSAIVTTAFAFQTPGLGKYGTMASFILSAVTIGTVTTAMLLGHWYLVVPNLSTRPLLALLVLLAMGFLLQAALDAFAVSTLTGHAGVISRAEVLTGRFAAVFWIGRLAVGIGLPLLITGLAVQSTRTRSLMSATGLLYVAVVLTLVGQVTGKVIFFSGNLPL